jgi:hypothetical protein
VTPPAGSPRVIPVCGAIVAALLLSGCAAETTAVSPPSPSRAAAGAPAATNTGNGTEGSSPAAEGAYIDYAAGVIEQTPGTKVVFFHAPWCSKCRALEKSILAEGVPAGMTIIKADFDSELELRQRYGVTLQTTVVYVDDAGNALSSAVLSRDTTMDAVLAAAP